MTLDKPALPAWLRSHAEHPELVVYAVLTGLAGRIERGDFDEKDPPRNGGGITGVEVESGAQVKTAPAGALTPVLRGLTPGLEGLMPTIVAPTSDTATGTRS